MISADLVGVGDVIQLNSIGIDETTVTGNESGDADLEEQHA